MTVRSLIVLLLAVAAIASCTAPVVAPSASPTASSGAVVTATQSVSGKGTWTADTGIYGTSFHYGPPSYICGVGYNLSYGGGAPLVSVDVSVLFPDAFANHVTAPSVDLAIGWQHPITQINSPSAVHDSAWLSRLGDAIGAVCQNGPSDLDSLRGTTLKVSWTTGEGSYEQEFRVETIRGEMTIIGMPDGRTRVCWANFSGC